MSYVDGFVIPVPDGNRDAFVAQARKSAPVFLDHGATRVVECWGDDVPAGKTTDFRMAVKAEGGETVAFAFVEWPDKATRDAGMKAVMDDPRSTNGEPMPFDGKRMIFGGFSVVLDEGKG